MVSKNHKIQKALFLPEQGFFAFAGCYELTRERIRQIKDKALVRLRANSRGWVLKRYLD